MWIICKKFNVLPTDDRFQRLTDDQINWIINNMETDVKEQRKATKGLTEAFEDDNTDWQTAPEDEWEPLKEGHTEEEINRQISELVDEDALERAKQRYKSAKELNQAVEEGKEDAITLYKRQIKQDNIRKAYEEAEARENGTYVPEENKAKNNKPDTDEYVPLTNESVSEAIEAFNKMDSTDTDDDIDDDWF